MPTFAAMAAMLRSLNRILGKRANAHIGNANAPFQRLQADVVATMSRGPMCVEASGIGGVLLGAQNPS